jgi:hypothetical protein
MKKYSFFLLALCTSFCISTNSNSQEPEEYDLYGEWRYVVSHAQDFPLNAAGTSSGLNLYVDQRLDIGTEAVISDEMTLVGEIEIFYGQVYGDADTVGLDLRDDGRDTLRGWDLKQADLRQLWLSYSTSFGKFKVGQMSSHWGLGLLANDGRPQPDRFGFCDLGDLSDRIIFASRPFASLGGIGSKIIVALGGGIVYLDENASLRLGDIGAELLFSTIYKDGELEIGTYIAGRLQEDADDAKLNVAAIDLFASWDKGEGISGPVLATEMTFITGKTDRIIQADRLEGLDVSTFGAVARAGWRFTSWGLLPQLELGYASGDANTDDNTVTAFSFDPDYKVGLVLFDVVMRQMSAMAAEESADPDRVGTPLPGTDMLATRGRVSGALYLHPTIRIKPIEQLTLLVGGLFAWSTVSFAQSYQTFNNGGVPTNAYGLSNAGRNLGMELDIGADWDQKIWNELNFVTGIQAGWFFPGSAFDRPDGTRPGIIARLQARAAIYW